LQHPGIVYRDGRTGRRTALAVGPDVWEVASALRFTTGTDERRVAALAEQFDLHPKHIRTAVDFAAGHRQEIDAQVAANHAAAEEARRLAERRAALMASRAFHLASVLDGWAVANPEPYPGPALAGGRALTGRGRAGRLRWRP